MTVTRSISRISILLLVLAPTVSFTVGDEHRDEVVYVDETEYPVLEEMKERNDKRREAAEAETQAILERIRLARKEREDAEQELRFDLSGVSPPSGPSEFERIWHFPPTPQYLTGSCWSFSATSFLESEIDRLHGRKVKLSEMWTVYWDFVEKARRYVRRRGESVFPMGSEASSILRIYARYGAVPRSVYEGVLAEDGRFDHSEVYAGMKELLTWCKQQAYWDEPFVLDLVRSFLDRTMGRPPERFSWQGHTVTPREFLSSACELELDDYVFLMSTLAEPFWERGLLDVPDNWWRDESYLNVPLEAWYETIIRALRRGYGVVIGLDVSEPGLSGPHDVGVVPTFDVPPEHIDQHSREFRLNSGATTDDHGVHLVGFVRHGDHDWFLAKDSNRSSRLGRFEGYYMLRDDYVRLKVLTIGVHEDVAGDLLNRLAPAEQPR